MFNDRTIIIPGHGDLCDKNDVKELKSKLQFCIDEIKKKKLLGVNFIIILNILKIDLDGCFKRGCIKLFAGYVCLVGVVDYFPLYDEY